MPASLHPIVGLPIIEEGDDLAQLIVEAAEKGGVGIEPDDVLVVAQKIVSKAEGNVVRLASVEPTERAFELAESSGLDPRLCEVYLRESRAILGTEDRVVGTRSRQGFICRGAGVDRSNVAAYEDECVLCLPIDPDRSARSLRAAIERRTGSVLAVIIADSFGRDDRVGVMGLSIGLAGIEPILAERGEDLFGNPTRSRINQADCLAAATSMLMGQTDRRIPAVIVRGADYRASETASAAKLVRH